MKFACRRLALLSLPLFLLSAGPCLADDGKWSEPRFDPPVGSKWIVSREVNVEKNSGGTMVGHTLKQTALLTVEEKTADGYVMTYERQSSTYDGDPSGDSVERIAYAAEKGVVMKVVTDAAGKPLRVVNFDETKAALKDALKVVPLDTADPVKAANFRKVADRMVTVTDKQAAELYLNELPLLALGQDTGLQPGDMRTVTVPVANPLVSNMTKVLTISISKDDPAAGKVRYLATETYDPESMKTLISETIKDLEPNNPKIGMLDQVMSHAKISSVGRLQLDVEGGMTRELRRQSVVSFQAPGGYGVTKEDQFVTVTPAAE
jgi:hypothetical protein